MAKKSVICIGTRMSRMDRQVSVLFFSLGQYVRMMSRMDRQVSVISSQFQFSRIQSSKSVRPYGGPNQKKEKTNTEKHRNTDPIGGNTFTCGIALNLLY
jgi:hypothetical protein